MADNFPAEAVGVLATQVHDPVFFDKLAEWNIHPRTQPEREQLLELATMLREAKDSETIKTASDGNPFLGGAIDSLRIAMGTQGYNAPSANEVAVIKNAAARAVASPALQEAALAYGAYLANLDNGN